jgi:hypothetical protein
LVVEGDRSVGVILVRVEEDEWGIERESVKNSCHVWEYFKKIKNKWK